jgi:AcrR family transcriptional regulator
MGKASADGGLDCATIAAAAVRVGGAHGVAGLTRERVASELGVSDRTLARHVKSREELVGLIVDAVAERRDAPPDDADWEALLRYLADGSRDLAHTCPGIQRFMLDHRVPTRAGRSYIERTLAALIGAGLTVEEAADVFFTFSAWVTRYLSIDPGARARRAAGGPAPAAASDDDLLDSRVLRVLAPAVSQRTDEAEFDTGVDWLVSAVGARIDLRRAGSVTVLNTRAAAPD